MNALLWAYKCLVDSVRFIRFSIAQVASLYPPGKPVVLFPFGKRTLIFTSAKACEHVLSHPKHAKNYRTRFGVDSGLRELGMLNCGLIWNNDVALWKESRESFQKGLNKQTLDDVVKVAPTVVDLVMQKMPYTADKTLHMMHALRWITLNFTMVQLLGLPLVDTWSRASFLIEAIVDYFKAWEFFLVRPWYSVVLSREYKTHQAASRALHKISEELLCEYEALNGKEDGGFSCMSNAYKKYKAGVMTRTDVVQLILEILLAGVDTSSVTMFYTLGYLAENPKWKKQVMFEIIQTVDDPVQSPILEACLKESMRLKPVGPIIMRRANCDDVVDELKVHQGDQIILHLEAMNVHGVENSRVFDPGRFLEQEKCPMMKPSFGFYPFGAGPKGCVGQYLAMAEMKACLLYLLREYHIDTTTSMKEMETNWDIAQQPQRSEEMYMTVHRRPRCVFFVGPSSTGKTTLLQSLSSHKLFQNAKIQHEIARTQLANQGWTREDLRSSKDANLSFQRMLIKEYAQRQAKPVLNESLTEESLELFDRSAIDALVYAPGGVEHLIQSEDFQQCLLTYRDSKKCLIVLFPVVESLRRDDGVRMLPTCIEDHQAQERFFEKLFAKLDIQFFKLSADLDQRQTELMKKVLGWSRSSK